MTVCMRRDVIEASPRDSMIASLSEAMESTRAAYCTFGSVQVGKLACVPSIVDVIRESIVVHFMLAQRSATSGGSGGSGGSGKRVRGMIVTVASKAAVKKGISKMLTARPRGDLRNANVRNRASMMLSRGCAVSKS